MNIHQYNPQKHHRRSIRLQGYDYAQAGLYFITICCQNRTHRFGAIINDEMILNEYGAIAHHQWEILPQRFKNIQIHEFQIMPNHMHGIIEILSDNVRVSLADTPNSDNVRASLADAHNDNWAGASPAPTDAHKKNNNSPIGSIVGSYKSLVANKCLELYKSKDENMGKLWQRNYYEHIIRNEIAYHKISSYIANNPLHWKEDSLNQ